MGKGGKAEQNGTTARRYDFFTTEEIQRHNASDDKWLVIDGKVYDISTWAKKHPGGARIISHYAGEDATDAWVAFHDDKDYVRKFMKTLLIGEVRDYAPSAIQQDFRELRSVVERSGWMKTNPVFFIAHFLHIIALEAVAALILWQWGTGWLPYLAAATLFASAQAQAGWTQHDYGHLSVFNNNRVNHIFHHITVGVMKGASSHWWNFRHYQHHAKPNVVRKDPDVNIALLFLLGDKVPVQWGQKKRGKMPYQWQHNYFFLLGPPLLLPLYFHIENLYFVFKRRDWVDLAMTVLFFVRYFYILTFFMSGWQAFWFYMFVRFLESHWFVWVTQMNHIPMDVDHDSQRDWVNLQLKSTCNVDPSFFNDWFTGHLNFQIEHHLFPTMPRHNYGKVAPLVKSLCQKHGVPYVSKPLFSAFSDLYRSLKKSGHLWYEAYYDL